MSDYIKRGRIISHIYNNVPLSVFMARSVTKASQSLGGLIEEIETVKADDVRKNVRAKWTKTVSDNYYCSVCHKEPYYGWSINEYKFCPYCGAKMKGELKND